MTIKTPAEFCGGFDCKSGFQLRSPLTYWSSKESPLERSVLYEGDRKGLWNNFHGIGWLLDAANSSLISRKK